MDRLLIQFFVGLLRRSYITCAIVRKDRNAAGEACRRRGLLDLALRPDGLIDMAISIDDNDVVLPAIPPALLAELGRRLVEATSSEVMAVGHLGSEPYDR